MTSWFKTTPFARVQAADQHQLAVLQESAPPRIIDISDLDWITFINIGENFLANEAGWWLLGKTDSALAISENCPIVDPLMRGQLAAVADAVGNLTILHLAAPPPILRQAQQRGGVIQLNGAELALIRDIGLVEHVSTVQAFPLLP